MRSVPGAAARRGRRRTVRSPERFGVRSLGGGGAEFFGELSAAGFDPGAELGGEVVEVPHDRSVERRGAFVRRHLLELFGGDDPRCGGHVERLPRAALRDGSAGRWFARGIGEVLVGRVRLIGEVGATVHMMSTAPSAPRGRRRCAERNADATGAPDDVGSRASPTSDSERAREREQVGREPHLPADSLSALGGTRTPNLLIRSQMLYPIELRAQRPASLRPGGLRGYPEPDSRRGDRRTRGTSASAISAWAAHWPYIRPRATSRSRSTRTAGATRPGSARR